MGETEHISVADVSEGPGGSGRPGSRVSLPVVELLTGRGFITGKSGSGKSNSASVVAERLLDNGFGLLIVDIDGEYYGLKEEYEILHVGADEECDIQITTDHAEKMATLALEQNVPIILDVSSFLDEDEAEEVLTEVARHLFAKAKKQKQPFLMLVEEVHEYIPENGSVGEAGKMLIKIGKRGRKHGLGIVGISQRPADVKKDFITQCDWLVWHRLTWDNDTKVVRRVLDGEYAREVEDLDDGEGFLMTDWSESIERVQFYRKKTFDAGATPGLDDFERPDLKSVSDDLVSELQEISDEKQARETRIQELREELDRKNSRIAELEKELQDARDMSRMADQFVDALVHHVEGQAPGRTEQERMKARRQATEASDRTDVNGARADGEEDAVAAGMDDSRDAESDDFGGPAVDSIPVPDVEDGDEGASSADASGDSHERDEPFSAEDVLERLRSVADGTSGSGGRPDNGNGPDVGSEPTGGAIEGTGDSVFEDGIIDGDESAPAAFRNGIEAEGSGDSAIIDGESENGSPVEASGGKEPLVVQELKDEVSGLETKARKMLSFYRQFGPGTPLNAHFAAGGDGDRTNAYAFNRTLRTKGLIEHVGRGRYDYRLRGLLREELASHATDAEVDQYASDIERAALDGDVETLDSLPE